MVSFYLLVVSARVVVHIRLRIRLLLERCYGVVGRVCMPDCVHLTARTASQASMVTSACRRLCF